MFAERELHRRNGVGKGFVAKHIVGMRRFFNPKRIDRAQPRWQMSSACGRVHCWLASTITRTLSPAISRTMFARRRSRSGSREPTFKLHGGETRTSAFAIFANLLVAVS